MYNEIYGMPNVDEQYYSMSEDEFLKVCFIQLSAISFLTGLFLYLVYDVFKNNNRVITIVRGLPGSGKTTWVDEQTSKIPNSISLNMDEYVVNNSDTLRRAHMRLLDILLYVLEKDKYNHIFVEGVFSRRWEYEVIENIAKLHNYKVRLVELVGLVDKKEMFKRSNYLDTSVWDNRWFKFLEDNWEDDTRAVYLDYESVSYSESESESEDEDNKTYSYFNVEDSEKTSSSSCRYNLRSRS